MNIMHFSCVGNPTVIPASGTVVLREGNQGNSRPVLIAFISGTPYPSAANISWWFNNGRSLPSGVIESRHELLLPGNIRSEIAGVYTCHVTTSAGSDSANISVSVICKPIINFFLKYYQALSRLFVSFLQF